jgi:hypothetical protein
MSAFQPKNPDHAIAAVAFTLSFRTPLNEAAIAKARQIEPSVKDFLPGLTSLGELPAAIALTGAQSLRSRAASFFSVLSLMLHHPGCSLLNKISSRRNAVSTPGGKTLGDAFARGFAICTP